MYGITETTVHVSFRTVESEDVESPRGSFVGPAMADLSLFFLDRHGRPVPYGVAGEIHVGGPGLARGYVGRPGLTAERFVPDPWSKRPGQRLYRSGDLARRRGDGEIETLGRMDHQVKVRGFRIELGEIEACLLDHPDIHEVVVVTRTEGESTELIAYVVPRISTHDNEDAGLTTDQVRIHLGQRLPDYMQPSYITLLDGLPMNTNGKVDRKALPSPEPQRATGHRLAPRTPTEAVLVQIFEEVLDQRGLGVEDNFFALGGHSLRVTRAVSRIHDRLQVKIGLREVFAQPTPAGLASLIASKKRAVLEVIPRTSDGVDHELSHAQRRLWILARLVPGDITYNMAGALTLEGPLDREAFARALNRLVERHEALRTHFPAVEGEPRQRVLDTDAFQLESRPVADLDRGTEEAQTLATTAFDLERDLLFRALLLQVHDELHVFAYNMHHIVSDGWSLGVMERELGLLYAQEHAGSTEALPPLAIQYRDYAAWQNRWLAGEDSTPTRKFWRGQLTAPLPTLEMPTDRPRPTVKTFAGRHLGIPLDSGDLEERLLRLSLDQGASLFMLLLTAVATLLHRHTGQQDLILGSPVAGRDHPDLEPQIGFYVNTLPLRVRPTPEMSFAQLLAQVRETVTGALEHSAYPFDVLVDELEVERDPGRSPLFEVMVALQNQEASGLDLKDLHLRGMGTELAVSRFELTLNFFQGPKTPGFGGLGLAVEHNSDLFDSTRILRLGHHLRHLLDEVARRPETSLAGFQTMDRGERHQLLHEWNDAQSQYPREATLHGRVARFAEEVPHRIAVEFKGQWISYRELWNRSRRLAAHLLSRGLQPEEPVALYMERSSELIVAMVGVMAAGGAYLPLDPKYPDERLSYMTRAAGVRQVLTLERLRAQRPQDDCQVLPLDARPDPLAEDRPMAQAVERSGPLGVAYLMYTSGSTGQPKGVRVLHRGVIRLVRNTNYAQMTEDARHLHFATIAFDASTLEIWGALVNGAAISLFPPHLPTLEELGDFIIRRRYTHALFTTSLFLEMVASQVETLRHLQVLGAGGDAMPTHTARRARKHLSQTRLVNFYGPTEGSVAVTSFPFPEDIPSPVPIGRVLSNNHIYLMDRHFQPVPLGVAGELCMGGDGLARDYNGRPAATASLFVPDPLAQEPGGRLYRTGDLVRHRPDGQIDFLGRIDHQVKVRGFRIELGEIEAHLLGLERIRDTVVLAPKGPGAGTDRRLVAFLTTDGEAYPASELRDHLGQNLPQHMVPSDFLHLDDMPMTPNRKFDRRALAELALRHFAEGGSEVEHVEPRAGLEQQLAQLWRDVLGIPRVGVHDNFFDLGGHSLAAIRLHERIRKDLELDLTLVKLFEHPTLASLANHLKSTEGSQATEQEDGRDRGRRRRQALARSRRRGSRR